MRAAPWPKSHATFPDAHDGERRSLKDGAATAKMCRWSHYKPVHPNTLGCLEGDAMLSDIIALGAAGALGCTFFGWAIVLLTSSRHERLNHRLRFKREKWRAF